MTYDEFVQLRARADALTSLLLSGRYNGERLRKIEDRRDDITYKLNDYLSGS